jgi:Family of unknown function (DUF5808)
VGLAFAAIVKELRTPPGERSWHGKLGGVVPYDFRRPTMERVRAALWSPDDARLLRPHAFGLGWTVNLGRVVRLLSRKVGYKGD